MLQAIVLGSLATLGLSLNLVVLHRIFKASIWAADTFLMTTIAVFDCVTTLYAISSQLARLITKIYLTDGSLWCKIDHGLFVTFGYSTVLATGLLSLVRFLVIVKGWKISFKRCLVVFSILFGINLAIFEIRNFTIPLHVLPSGLYCMPDIDIEVNLLCETIYLLLLVPWPFIIVASYASVTVHYYKLVEEGANQAVAEAGIQITSSPTMTKAWLQQYMRAHRHVTMKLIFVMLAYSISLFPEFILTFLRLINVERVRSPAEDTIAFLLIFSLSVINPIFVLHLHECSRQEVATALVEVNSSTK